MSNQKNADLFRSALEELNDIVEQTFYFEQKVYELNKKVERNKDKILKSMGKKKEMVVDADTNLTFRVDKKVDTDVTFFKDQLINKFDKKMYKQLIDKEVVVNDVEGLVSMLKEFGVSPKEFKKFVDVKETVNRETIDNKIESGEILIEDLQGCYSAKFEESVHVKRVRNPNHNK